MSIVSISLSLFLSPSSSLNARFSDSFRERYVSFHTLDLYLYIHKTNSPIHNERYGLQSYSINIGTYGREKNDLPADKRAVVRRHYHRPDPCVIRSRKHQATNVVVTRPMNVSPAFVLTTAIPARNAGRTSQRVRLTRMLGPGSVNNACAYFPEHSTPMMKYFYQKKFQ